MASPIRSWTALRTSARWDRPGAVTVSAGAAVSMATTSLFRTGPASEEQSSAVAEVNSGYRFQSVRAIGDAGLPPALACVRHHWNAGSREADAGQLATMSLPD